MLTLTDNDYLVHMIRKTGSLLLVLLGGGAWDFTGGDS